ncbi:Type II toxin-antitoxin system PemK/MazF family toxin [Candidatus Cyrtobacter comes]|uniref:mRNA interferase n=1 Tax=Candidatus Cyrtobacter comes TaxID=675776 RepID=A0ABU5L996_9RICK|nr:type II toxin-antitoxin system PemK/MazF family toxin [Candidatus Cyrtobacter comes]MDZ5762690.1 Type II toxin-antitoxin system PemK/MazF family toxin [Candidatus Cyrtobacter comes]
MGKKYNFGEIWLADLNPRIGTESGKVRPVLIFQNQILLDESHPSTIVLPLTTKLIDNAEPLRIRVRARESLQKDSDIMIDQIRAIDNKRLVQFLLMCDDDVLRKVQSSLVDLLWLSRD